MSIGKDLGSLIERSNMLKTKSYHKKRCKFVKLDSANSKRALAARSYRKTNTEKILKDRDKRKKEFNDWLKG